MGLLHFSWQDLLITFLMDQESRIDKLEKKIEELLDENKNKME